MKRESRLCLPKCNESRSGKRGMTAAFPTIETKVVDGAEPDVTRELGPAAATNDHKCDARVTREPAQHAAGRGRQAHLIGAPRDSNERAVEIQKHGDAAACLDLGGYAIPIRHKVRS